MNVVLTMAGSGARFREAGRQSLPKYLIDVGGSPMVLWALESLRGMHFSSLVLVTLEHERNLIEARLGPLLAVCNIVYRTRVSEGQLCSALDARDYLADDEDLLILGCDTYVESNLWLDIVAKPLDCAGILSVAPMKGERWSFAKTDEQGRVVEVAEKRRVSDLACTGMYYFSKARAFVNAGETVIRRGERTKGEFYMIQAYDVLIERGERILVSAGQMLDMGTPEALAEFLKKMPNAPDDIIRHIYLATRPNRREFA